MSIKKVDMYTIECDGCGKESGQGEEICAWNDEDYALQEAIDSFDWIEVDTSKITPNSEKHYCPDCWEWNQSGEEQIPTQSNPND